MNAGALAFKLYGNFLWPPTRDLNPKAKRERGCVEIRYARTEDAEKPYRACLLWCPSKTASQARGELSKEPLEIPQDTPNLYEIDAPHEWFEDPRNANKPIWIDGPAKEPEAALVVFRGAFLFEQYVFDERGSRRELRWPLVPEYDNGKSKVYSSLTIKEARHKTHPLHPRFDFDLSLPLPVKHADDRSWPAFPLCAVYYPRASKPEDIGTIDILGPKGFHGRQSVGFWFEQLEKGARLGRLHLTAAGEATKGFAVFTKQSNIGDLRDYWPAANTVAGEVLQKTGLSSDTMRPGNAPAAFADAQLRFMQPTGDGGSGGWVYRARADALHGLPAIQEIEGPIKFEAPAYVDVALSWMIDDDHVWEPESWRFAVDLELLWAETFTGDDFRSGSDLDTFARRLLAKTAARIRATREAIPLDEGVQPVSLLPELSVDGRQIVVFALRSERWEASRDGQGLITWIPPRLPSLRMTLAGGDAAARIGRAGNRLALRGTLPAFMQNAPVLSLELSSDEAWASREANSSDDGSPYFASFGLQVTGIAKESGGRIGSLAFDIPQRASSPVEDPDFLRTAGHGLGRTHAKRYPRNDFLAASIRLTLPVSRVTPLATDVARIDRTRRPAPLLIPLSETAQKAGGYLLRVVESFGTDEDREMTASLLDLSQEQGDREYVLLAEEPYSILRFIQKPLSARGDAATTEVAIYSSDDRIWQYRVASPHYHFILPPQAVGESADKPRRLEIHDLSAAPKDGIPPRPYIGPDEQQDPDPHVLRRRAVEFRLTPSAELWIHPSDVARGYFMPEQASYEIFRQRGEYGLGAALAGLRAEFLYGLTVGVDAGNERSIARFARVAEIGALTGAILAPPREHHADARIGERWNRLSRAIARRSERLELWARDPDSPVDFAPARFSDGASFALRTTALHRAPLRDADTGEGEAPESAPGAPRFHPHGLSGGALWPVESLNLLAALKARPASKGGAIERIALAPFGGDAAQQAKFLNGIVKIISETRNGFVERHKVEVVGRIGAFWHRAKHVIVYERTVNPSAQFAPKVDRAGSRSRRPILRKVREYIELLQPERSYPDFPQGQPRSTGFLDRVRFNAKIINVDSAWSSEVGKDAWRIPLWNRASARERPQVYPMPDIAFVTIAEGDGENPVVAQECLDPDNIVFFSDFSEKTSDTDLWPPHLDIDYANLPLAQTIARIADAASSRRPDDGATADFRRPAVTRFLPGARRFTWRLAPAARKTAINAGRAAKPLYVGLDSVSFMRAAFDPKEEGARKFEPLGNLLAASQTIKVGADIDFWPDDGSGTRLKGADTAAYARLLAAMKSAADETALRNAYLALQDFWQRQDTDGSTFSGDLSKALADNAKPLGKAIKPASKPDDPDPPPSLYEAIRKTKEQLGTGRSRCEKLRADALDHLKRKSLLITSALQEWQATSDAILAEPQRPTTKAEAIEAIETEIAGQLRPLFQEVSDDVGNARDGVEKARALLLDLEAQAEASVARLRARIDQLCASYDRNKPWSPERSRRFRTDLHAAASSLASDIRGAIDEARQRLSVELDDLGQTLAGQLGQALAKIAEDQSKAMADLGSLKAALKRLIRGYAEFLESLSPTDPNAKGKLDDLIAGLEEAGQKVGAESNLPDALKTAALAALDDLGTAAEQAKQAVSDARERLAEIKAAEADAIKALSAAVSGLASAARGIVEGLRLANDGVIAQAAALGEAGFDALQQSLRQCWPIIADGVEELSEWIDGRLAKLRTVLDDRDKLVVCVRDTLREALTELIAALRALHATINTLAQSTNAVLHELQSALAPERLLKPVIIAEVVRPALNEILAPIPEDIGKDFDASRGEIRRLVANLAEKAADRLLRLEKTALDGIQDISALCSEISGGIDEAGEYLTKIADDAKGYFDEKLGQAKQKLDEIFKPGTGATLEQLQSAAMAFDRSVRGLHNDLARAGETARQYGDRVLAAGSRLGEGGIMAAPNNVLKLYSAVSSAPELAGLKADIDRIRSGFDELSDIVDTTEASALFNRFGDELEALGLSIPFDRIGDRLLPADLSGLDVGRLFRNVGGARLDKLFRGYKLPDAVRDAIRISHDFDPKQARAWVQVDIDAPMPGRRTLFAVGPFQCDFVDMRIVGQVRLEASKDTDQVAQTGFGRLATTLDIVVGGQSMVRFEKFALNFTKENGLGVDFDPKNIRLNPAFEFVQEALIGLFPDALGPLTVIKENGIPVGVEHEYALPVMSANAVTSGISNISIENRFRLIAHPDFMLADRFSLSRPERPFIFSIFILGGTGYVQVEAEYRPFDSELTVTVDAAAGASALLGISAGPFSGQVFIALSAVLGYRKVIGRPGGGLSVTAMLVIAGNVDVMGIATVGIYVMLRLTYRDTGQIDADGTLCVTIKISQFFKITARAGVQYRLRNGRAEVRSSASIEAQPEERLKSAFEKAENAAKKVQGAMC